MMSKLCGVTDDAGRRQPKNPLGPTGGRVLTNIKRLRQARGLTYKELSDRLERLGRPIPVLGLSRLEKGERRVDVDDLVALALALGVTPNRLMLPDIDVPGTPTEEMLTQNVQARPSRLWEWAQGERHPPLPFRDAHSWFGGERHPNLRFAIENRPYLTSASTRAAVAATTEPVPAGIRDLMLAALAVMTKGLEDGRRYDDLASQVRRIVELLITYPEVMPVEQIRDTVEHLGIQPGGGEAEESRGDA